MIHGADDPLISVAAGRDTAAVIPGARLEIVPPPAGAVVDWTVLRDTAAAPADIDPTPLALRAGATYSRQYPFSA